MNVYKNITTTQLKSLSSSEIAELAQEIRETIMDTVSKNGGHLASNLGMVEATIALHRVFNSPQDKFIFDVGHQCYAHKILSGRQNEFGSIRVEGGLSGFPDKDESEYDLFTVGHAGTAMASGLGLCNARDKKGEDYAVISFIGDGSIVNGLNLEALFSCNKKPKNFHKALHTFKNIGTTIYEGPFKNARKEASYGTSKQTDGENTDGR